MLLTTLNSNLILLIRTVQSPTLAAIGSLNSNLILLINLAILADI